MKERVTAIGFETDDLKARAITLAEALDLVVDNEVFPRLCLTAERLVLLMRHFSPLFVDFNSKAWQKRRDAGKKQGLVRACKPAKGVRILDATAGWGRDAAVLASFGATVVMLEREPVMAALLNDALERFHAHPMANLDLSLLSMDAKRYLQSLLVLDYPDVIYIDPMHPLRTKSALVKKDMQALQKLVGVDEDAYELITLARTRVRERVVVKWPQHLPSLLPPSASIHGKTVRFDLFCAI